MSVFGPTRSSPGSLHPRVISVRGSSGPSERSKLGAEYNRESAMDDRSVAAMRHLTAESKLDRAIFELILAAHEVNRWDLTRSTVDALCDAALVYASALKTELEERHG